MAAHGGEIRRLVPAVEAAEPVRAEPALEQARLFDAVTDLLHRAAEDRTVVLVLDDLHWAAPSTIASAAPPARRRDPNHRLCVLGTYRDTEVDRSHALGGLLADIHRSVGVERSRCAGSMSQGIEDLVAAASGDELDDRSRALAAALVERTAGNPFFANQVLRHLVERGVVVQDGGRWTIRGSLDDVDLPEGVLDVVGRRLSRLSPAANQALAVAALCGLEFGVRVLMEVPDAGDSRRGRRRSRRSRQRPPAGRDRSRTLRLHPCHRARRAHPRADDRQAGPASTEPSAKRSSPSTATRPAFPCAELARHFTEAAVLGDSAAAARWATAAAAAAADQADHRGAIAVLERALEVIEAVEPVDQAARFDVAAAAAEGHYALAEADSAPVGSAVAAARRLRSGARMLRSRHGPFQPRAGGDRPRGDRAVRRGARASRPRGDTAARLSPSRYAPGVVRYRPTPGSSTTSTWRTRCFLTSSRARPRSPPRFASGLSRPPWVSPALAPAPPVRRGFGRRSRDR